jgi:hypothetical protein
MQYLIMTVVLMGLITTLFILVYDLYAEKSKLRISLLEHSHQLEFLRNGLNDFKKMRKSTEEKAETRKRKKEVTDGLQ